MGEDNIIHQNENLSTKVIVLTAAKCLSYSCTISPDLKHFHWLSVEHQRLPGVPAHNLVAAGACDDEVLEGIVGVELGTESHLLV